MSIEIRNICSRPGDCTMGQIKPAGFDDHCSHHFECDWGVFTNSDASPEPEHLLLAVRSQVESLLGGSAPERHGGVIATDCQDERLFAYLYRDGRSWVWELFDALFSDGGPPGDIMVGRWPD